MNNKIAIESLSMDLLRVAIGYHKGSTGMAKRFSDEALKRLKEINREEVKPYFSKILALIYELLSKRVDIRTADDALMYSVRCRNYVKHFC